MPQPIKRHASLQPLSRDHHHGLLLCWKIRTGLKKEIELSRIKSYTDWFYCSYLLTHFEVEEKSIFPILGNQNPLIEQAILEHKNLRILFEDNDNLESNLNKIAETLDKHIRFEERILFNEIQKIATPIQIKAIENVHHEVKFVENLIDPFWERQKVK